MSNKNDGGPAGDMSVRTWLAGKALEGILAGINQTAPSTPDLEEKLQGLVVKSSRALADAMLVELDEHAL